MGDLLFSDKIVRIVIKYKKETEGGTVNFGRYLRTGLICAAAALTTGPSTTNLDCYFKADIGPIVYRQPEVKLFSEVEIFCKEAKQAQKEDGSWDLDELRDMQGRYFEYVKNAQISSEELAKPMLPLIIEVSKTVGVPWKMVEAVTANESDFYSYTVGKKGELGLMQIDPKKNRLTKEESENIFDERTNLTRGARILKANLKEFHGDMRKAIMAYNAGSERVIRGHVYRETREYLQRAIEHMEMFEQGYKQ